MKLGNTTVIRSKYQAIEQALNDAGLSPVRCVQNDEVFAIQCYGASYHDVNAVADILAQFDEEFNIGISLDTNRQQITIV